MLRLTRAHFMWIEFVPAHPGTEWYRSLAPQGEARKLEHTTAIASLLAVGTKLLAEAPAASKAARNV